MIGRGVFANPYCFTDYAPSREDLEGLLLLHLELYEKQTEKYAKKYPGKALSFEPMKHFIKIYINGFPGASAMRVKFMEAHSVTEAKAILMGRKNRP